LKDLPPEEQEAFLRGVAQFNAGFYFECHDTLEEIWTGLRGPSRDFVQGLIQVSVAFYHLSSGNLVGAESLFRRALKRLEGYPGRCYGFDLEAQRREIGEWLGRVADGSSGSYQPPYATWRFDEEEHPGGGAGA
jgi:predicted metal-dependent hydrolase